MLYRVADPAVSKSAHRVPEPVPVPLSNRALLTDEEWQALLWPVRPLPHDHQASEVLPGDAS